MVRANHVPIAKAQAIIKNPFSAEAAPAIFGNGDTAPDWLQGW